MMNEYYTCNLTGIANCGSCSLSNCWSRLSIIFSESTWYLSGDQTVWGGGGEGDDFRDSFILEHRTLRLKMMGHNRSLTPLSNGQLLQGVSTINWQNGIKCWILDAFSTQFQSPIGLMAQYLGQSWTKMIILHFAKFVDLILCWSECRGMLAKDFSELRYYSRWLYSV